jgi:hypothetical protein
VTDTRGEARWPLSAGAAKRSPRPSSADRDSLLCRFLSAVCRARYASPPVRVERHAPGGVKAVQVDGSGVGARSSER